MHHKKLILIRNLTVLNRGMLYLKIKNVFFFLNIDTTWQFKYKNKHKTLETLS